MVKLSFSQFIAPTVITKPDDATPVFQELQDTIQQLQNVILALNKEIEALKNK